MTINKVYVNIDSNAIFMPMMNQTPEITISSDGNIPALHITYEDNAQYLAVVTKVNEMDFVRKQISFHIEEFMWNSIFNKWDRTKSSAFVNNKLSVLNTHKVRNTDGKWEENLSPEDILEIQDEDNQIALVGEYDFWVVTLGKQIIFAGLLDAMELKFNTWILSLTPPSQPEPDPEVPPVPDSTPEP